MPVLPSVSVLERFITTSPSLLAAEDEALPVAVGEADASLPEVRPVGLGVASTEEEEPVDGGAVDAASVELEVAFSTPLEREALKATAPTAKRTRSPTRYGHMAFFLPSSRVI